MQAVLKLLTSEASISEIPCLALINVHNEGNSPLPVNFDSSSAISPSITRNDLRRSTPRFLDTSLQNRLEYLKLDDRLLDQVVPCSCIMKYIIDRHPSFEDLFADNDGSSGKYCKGVKGRPFLASTWQRKPKMPAVLPQVQSQRHISHPGYPRSLRDFETFPKCPHPVRKASRISAHAHD